MPPPLKVDGKGKAHNFKDWSGKEINEIKLYYPVSRANDGHILYLAQCFCGNFFITRPQRLLSGNTKSCGCYKIAKTIEMNHKKTEEIIGNIYGYLEVLDFYEYREYNGTRKAFYKCFCHNCGSISYHAGSDLKCGNIKSCGCVSSWKEVEIKKILTKNNFIFKEQYSFKNLKNPKTNYKLRFDFAIFHQEKIVCLIEYQGEQHYQKDNPWYTEEGKERDNLKREYCKKNSIPLIELNKDSNLEDLPKIILNYIGGG